MKKGMKRILALLVLVVMMVCVAQSVFAVNESTCKYYKNHGKHNYKVQGDVERTYVTADDNFHTFKATTHEKCASCGALHDIVTSETNPHVLFNEGEASYVWQSNNTQHWKYWTQSKRCKVCYKLIKTHWTNTQYNHSYWRTGKITLSGKQYNVKYCDCGKYMITGMAK